MARNEGQKDRAFFSQMQIDAAYIRQGGMCGGYDANGSPCQNALASGFQAHHKDKDHSNNKDDNCQLLCVPCHTKTFSEDPLKQHNDFVKTLMDYRMKAIEKTLDNDMKGTDLERVLAAIEQQKADSWTTKGLKGMFLYPSANIKMEGMLVENKIIQEAEMRGFVLGMKSVTKTLKEA